MERKNRNKNGRKKNYPSTELMWERDIKEEHNKIAKIAADYDE